MNVLVIGSGGREHALVWKIAQSPKVNKIYCAPGNTGIAKNASCVAISVNDIDSLISFAKNSEIDLTVVGPEGPLAAGIVDRFELEGLKIFGATKNAAEIESSKSFAKNLMNKYNIPTAKGETFSDYMQAKNYINKKGTPIVIKADGLAAGKGVLVCTTKQEAYEALEQIINKRIFNEAGDRVIIEEYLTGEEASFIAFTDGKTVLPLPSSQDHKQIFEEDKGPNTGGMGAYSPAPVIDRYMHDKILNEVMIPTVNAMAKENRTYKGVLYAGLMIKDDKIKVLEFNARFGDPETQPVLMRIKNDIVPVMEAVIDGSCEHLSLEIDEKASVCVVMASKGYPGSYEKGMPISGLNDAGSMKDVVVFHAGTSTADNQIVTNGGRVLGVTALGNLVQDAISNVYKAVSKISWNHVYYRKDIGNKAIKRLNTPYQVGIVMGSDSDLGIMIESAGILKKFGIPYEMTVASAHRSPESATCFARSAQKKGIKVIIAGAGHAAHLAGTMAANTTIPVIGVPINSSSLQGMDALLSTVQMPPGIPVATVSIGKSGAKNAGILAAQIIALSDEKIANKLNEYKNNMSQKVKQKAKQINNLS